MYQILNDLPHYEYHNLLFSWITPCFHPPSEPAELEVRAAERATCPPSWCGNGHSAACWPPRTWSGNAAGHGELAKSPGGFRWKKCWFFFHADVFFHLFWWTKYWMFSMYSGFLMFPGEKWSIISAGLFHVYWTGFNSWGIGVEPVEIRDDFVERTGDVSQSSILYPCCR